MTPDVLDVQTGTTSAGDVSTTTVPQPQTQTGTAGTTIPPTPPVAAPPATTASQYLTRDDLKAILAEERGRVAQSAKDRTLAELQKRAEEAERRAGTYRSHLERVDPESLTSAELADLKAEKAAREQAEQTARFHDQVREDLREEIQEMGLDPNDTRIAWNEPADDFRAYHKNVLKSAAKAAKEERTKTQVEVGSIEQRVAKGIEDGLRQARIAAGLESVDTSTGMAPTAGSDKDFLARWGSGELPATKENTARAQKLTQ